MLEAKKQILETMVDYVRYNEYSNFIEYCQEGNLYTDHIYYKVLEFDLLETGVVSFEGETYNSLLDLDLAIEKFIA